MKLCILLRHIVNIVARIIFLPPLFDYIISMKYF